MKHFNIGDELDLEVYAEICCDECQEIIHNHIDCPVCQSEYVATDQFCDLHDEKELTCENCGTTFEKTSESWYCDCKVKIASFGNKYN